METATKNLKEMKAPTPATITVKAEPLHKVDRRGKKPAGTQEVRAEVKCHRCGALGHLAPACRFKESTCHKCGKKGHLAKVCRGQAKQQEKDAGKFNKRAC